MHKKESRMYNYNILNFNMQSIFVKYEAKDRIVSLIWCSSN